MKNYITILRGKPLSELLRMIELQRTQIEIMQRDLKSMEQAISERKEGRNDCRFS